MTLRNRFLSTMLMLRWFEHSQVYHPDRALIASGAELGRPFEDVWFRAADGIELNGWFYPVRAPSPRSSWVVLLCHGNAGNISHRLDTCRALLAAGVGVFLFDYRGFGRSQGRPGEEGTYRDAQAAYQWLRARGFAGNNIVACGESLGGGVATELALGAETGGLILISTFTSLPAIGAELFPWLPVRWIATIKYNTAAKLPRLHMPVLIMHSRADELIAFHHAQRNFDLANEPKMFVELAGGHNAPLADQEPFQAALEKFLGLVESRSPSRGEAPTKP